MVAGGLRALRQHDLKLLLAFGTVSQLGFLFVLFGAGTAEAATGRLRLLLLAHALFKAALFMVVGIIDHETGTRDMRALPGLGRRWRPVVVDRRGERGVDGRRARWPSASWPRRPPSRRSPAAAFGGARRWCSPASSVGSVLTVAYSLRFVWGALRRRRHRLGRRAAAGRRPSHSPSAVVRGARRRAGRLHRRARRRPRHRRRRSSAPPPQALDPRRRRRRTSRSGTASTSPLVLSAVALAGGALLFVARRPVARVLAAGRRIPSGADVYLAGPAGPERGRRPGHRRRPDRLAAGLRGP